MALSRAKCQGDRRGYHAGSVRIAIVTDYYYPHLGGITEHVHGQATELTRRGHEVTIVTGNVMRPPPIVDGEIRPEANVPFEIVRVGRALPGYGNASQTYHVVDPLLRSKLKRIFERRKVDVVHVHSPYSPILPMVGVLAAPKSAVTVGTFHSVFPRSFGFDIAAPFMRRVIGRLDGKIVVSEACIGSLAPYLPYAYTVIPNGIDDRHFSPEADPIPELRDGKLNILFLGRFDPRNGLDTMIGERGVRLSGGQRQRLGLARALYTRPLLLVLDEATSALDAETERAIIKTLDDLEGSVTTVTVAHRLATVRRADQLIYMRDARIECRGTFDEVRSQVADFDRQALLLGL